MEIDRRYRKFVWEILRRGSQRELGINFKFENIDVYLEPREYLLVSYAISKQRPTNFTIAKILFDFIRGYPDIDVPQFIYDHAIDRHMELMFSTKTEEGSYNRSLGNTGPKNGRYKGTIFAVDIKTEEIKAMDSKEDMERLGFLPSAVYECVNGNQYTHRGHVFLREDNYKKPRKSQREQMGLNRGR